MDDNNTGREMVGGLVGTGALVAGVATAVAGGFFAALIGIPVAIVASCALGEAIGGVHMKDKSERDEAND